MAEKEYIEREAARLAYEKSLANDNHRIEGASAIHRQEHHHILHILEKLPAAEVISRGVFEQIKWERDMAMQQLEEHGIPFCGKADVDAVRYGEWIDKPTGAYGRMQSWCSACGKHSGIGGIESNRHKPYCPNCGAKMDGERKDIP